MPYQNVPNMCGMAISMRLATLHELKTVYTLEDLFMMVEVVNIDSYNKNLSFKSTQERAKGNGREIAIRNYK